jgi:hypothetical protein
VEAVSDLGNESNPPREQLARNLAGLGDVLCEEAAPVVDQFGELGADMHTVAGVERVNRVQSPPARPVNQRAITLAIRIRLSRQCSLWALPSVAEAA